MLNNVKEWLINNISKMMLLLFIMSWCILICIPHTDYNVLWNLNLKILTEDLPIGIIISSIFYFISYKIPHLIEQHKFDKLIDIYFSNIFNSYYRIFSFIIRLSKEFYKDIDLDINQLKKRDFMFLDGHSKETIDYFNFKIGYYLQSFNGPRVQQIDTLNECIDFCRRNIISNIKMIKEYSCNGLKLNLDKILIIKEIDESILKNSNHSFQGYGDVSNTLFNSYNIFVQLNWLNKKYITQIDYMSNNDLFQQQHIYTPKVMSDILINIPENRKQHKVAIINSNDYICKLITKEVREYSSYNFFIKTLKDSIDYDLALVYVYDLNDIRQIECIPLNIKVIGITYDDRILNKIKNITKSYYLINKEYDYDDICKLRNNIIETIDCFFGIK